MKLLGVTGCPTGVAHTFMAAEALTKAAEEAGCTIKVETHGAVGVENAFTAAEIEEADAIIIASDKDAKIHRFVGKPVVQASVAKGMKNADELVEQCMKGEAPILKGDDKDKDAKVQAKKEANQGESIGHQIYRHLMNGVSHMLPLVVAGGVLTAVSFF